MDDGSTNLSHSMTDPEKSTSHHHKNSGGVRTKVVSGGSKGNNNISVSSISEKATTPCHSNMVTVVPSDELMEYSPSSEISSKPVDLSNNNNSVSTNHHHHPHHPNHHTSQHLGQDAPTTASGTSMPSFNNSNSSNNNNNNNNNESTSRKHVGSSLSLNCGGGGGLIVDGNSNNNSSNNSNSSSSSSNGSISSVNSGGGGNNNNGILCGGFGIGIIGANSPLTTVATRVAIAAVEPPTTYGSAAGGGTGRKLSFSVENILDPNKFTGKTSQTSLHSPHHKNLLPSPKLLAAAAAQQQQQHHHHHPPSSNFRFAYKEIHGKGKYEKKHLFFPMGNFFRPFHFKMLASSLS